MTCHKDVAPCLGCVSPNGVEDHMFHLAPFFCACFPLEDSTSVPEGAKRLVYALYRTQQCIDSGLITKAFMHGEYKTPTGETLRCAPALYKGGKAIITLPKGLDGATQHVCPMRIQLRVYRASAANVDPRYYMWVTVHSPISFSLRQAVIETLAKSRNEEWVSDVKRIWGATATHIKHGFTDTADAGDEARRDAWGSGEDWLHVSNADSFTALFSAKRALQHMLRDYMEHNQDESLPEEIRGGCNIMAFPCDALFFNRCVHYDHVVRASLFSAASLNILT